jgi:CyaY protein
MAVELQLSANTGQKRRAGQRAQRLAPAADAAAAAGAVGKVKGPFWPHPASSTALKKPPKQRAAKLDLNVHFMPRILMSSPAAPARMSDADYTRQTASLLARIESTIDDWLQNDVVDIDSQRTGGLLELSFPNNSKIIINTQPPLQELWLAARGGGFHYRWAEGHWADTRDGSEFFSALSAHASSQAGQPLLFSV